MYLPSNDQLSHIIRDNEIQWDNQAGLATIENAATMPSLEVATESAAAQGQSLAMKFTSFGQNQTAAAWLAVAGTMQTEAYNRRYIQMSGFGFMSFLSSAANSQFIAPFIGITQSVPVARGSKVNIGTSWWIPPNNQDNSGRNNNSCSFDTKIVLELPNTELWYVMCGFLINAGSASGARTIIGSMNAEILQRSIPVQSPVN